MLQDEQDKNKKSHLMENQSIQEYRLWKNTILYQLSLVSVYHIYNTTK